MNRASFRTKSMSLNVSGKHNNKCKSMLCTEFFFALARIACCSSEQSIFQEEEKSSMESSFCGVNGFFFLSFAWLWICFHFPAIYSASMLRQWHTHTHPFLHFLECRNKNRSSTQLKNFKTSSRHKSSYVSSFFFSCCVCFLSSFFWNFLIRLLFIRFGFDLVSVALFMCPNAVHSWDCALWMALLHFTLSISHIYGLSLSFNAKTDTKMKLKEKKMPREQRKGNNAWRKKAS